VEVSAGEDYLPYQKTVTIDEDGIDLSGERRIKLEKDLRREARLLIEARRSSEAIKVLESVGENHPLYALMQHDLGEILLNKEQDPVKAAAAFHRVTSRPEVANFSDKRFVGTHINEAISLFHAGEQIAKQEPQSALAYWKQAIEIMNQTEPQLRFVPQDRYTQALHCLHFYRALSLHRTWALNQSQSDLIKAHAAWKGYIESTALVSPADRNFVFLKKAEAFYKHTEALMGNEAKVNVQAQSATHLGLDAKF
jgi:hypothetical protein